jgi:hypothetical protein
MGVKINLFGLKYNAHAGVDAVLIEGQFTP